MQAAQLQQRILEPKTPVVIGTGAFGQVTEAFDTHAGCIVAVKNMSLVEGNGVEVSKERIAALVAEIQLMKKLIHPNIVKYQGAYRTEDTLRIVMEYIAAGSVAKVIARYGRLPEGVARLYTRDMLRGLHYLHEHKVAHRDLKCDNLLLCSSGVVKLADFGCSKEIAIHEASTLTGTALFMAPEVALNKGTYDALAADVWTVGITVIQMLAGEPPYSGQFRNAVEAILHLARSEDVPPAPAHASEEAKRFITRCLMRDPTKRATVTELLEDPWMAVLDSELPRLPEPTHIGVSRPSAPGTPNGDDHLRARPSSRNLYPRPPSSQRVSPLDMGAPPVGFSPGLTQPRPGSGSSNLGGTTIRNSLSIKPGTPGSSSNGSAAHLTLGKSPRPHHLPSLAADDPLSLDDRGTSSGTAGASPQPPSDGGPSGAPRPSSRGHAS